ncbi:uncharacterized protein BHQ10_004800 [Talaromyces amestolkiae]|uniref:Uncharacterized protein n=1 Tax=Talaromyces amestolkiae TaxID=1196081 RepID=A0A364KZ19_TALAM|nr:uncharacterized protein BHQ10_004800 [Talaromyces amestolkiae]RAO68788.1 hypothetical protein BHQ10_004800 [Talaromyces amestolkiae]
MATTLGQPPFFTYFAWDSSSNAAQLEGAMNGLFQAGGPDTPAASAAVLFLFQHIASMLLFRLLRFYLTASFIFVLSRDIAKLFDNSVEPANVKAVTKQIEVV